MILTFALGYICYRLCNICLKMNTNNTGATRKRKTLSVRVKKDVLNIYQALHKANEDLNVSQLTTMTASTAG